MHICTYYTTVVVCIVKWIVMLTDCNSTLQYVQYVCVNVCVGVCGVP